MDCNKVNIKSGSTGEQVKELQRYLKYLGYYNSTVDGSCGSVTVSAIKKLQKQYKLKEDGVFGPVTCKACGINGVDVSKSSLTLDKSTYLDMFERYNKYIENNKKEPNIVYLDKDNPYKYITKEKIKEVMNYYNSYLEKNKEKPSNIALNQTSTQPQKNTTGIYTSKNHWIKAGCNKLGQCTSYYCGVHSIRQCNAKKDIDKYLESNIAGYAGTTKNGTSHQGIETALATIAITEGIKIKVKWLNFSDLGSTINERFKKLGELIAQDNTGVIVHNLYRRQYGHYEVIKQINTNNNTCVVLNSLGNKCSSPAYCGYLETRSFSTFASYISGISQKSICVITYE